MLKKLHKLLYGEACMACVNSELVCRGHSIKVSFGQADGTLSITVAKAVQAMSFSGFKGSSYIRDLLLQLA